MEQGLMQRRELSSGSRASCLPLDMEGDSGEMPPQSDAGAPNYTEAAKVEVEHTLQKDDQAKRGGDDYAARYGNFGVFDDIGSI